MDVDLRSTAATGLFCRGGKIESRLLCKILLKSCDPKIHTTRCNILPRQNSPAPAVEVSRVLHVAGSFDYIKHAYGHPLTTRGWNVAVLSYSSFVPKKYSGTSG